MPSISFFLAQTVDSQNALRLEWIVRQVADKHYLRGKTFRVHIWISTLTLRIKIQKKTWLVSPAIRTLPNNALMNTPQLDENNNEIVDGEKLIRDLDLSVDFWKGTRI